jgi:cobalt/nickel transport system permease protein/cobalt/nickel transport protein
MKSSGKILTTGVVVVILALAIVGSIALFGETTVREKGLWSDATDVLSSQAAKQVEREARAPFINTEKGNRLVFFFALAGVATGFTIGYNWRTVLADQARRKYHVPRRKLIFGTSMVVVCLITAWAHAFLRPLVNSSLGDVVLFVFVITGAISGFIAGNGFGGLKAEKVERRRLVA